MEAEMVGMRSAAAADGQLVGYGEKPDFSIYPPGKFDLFGEGEEKLAGWDPALEHGGLEDVEHIRLRVHDDLGWSGDGAERDHIVWRYQ
jgi:hypothetical protein